MGIVIYDYEFETKENKIWTKDKIKPQQGQYSLEFVAINLHDPYSIVDVNIRLELSKRVWMRLTAGRTTAKRFSG